MSEGNEAIKLQLANFGRTFVILLNRSFMYSVNHPFQAEAIDTAYHALTQLLQSISPAVFILNGEKFYVDEESLDPRLNISKIVTYFKKTAMESISFYKGVEEKELRLFLEIANSLNKYPDAEAMGKAMFKKQIDHIKINHVFYKKVSAEDEVISRDILDKVTPEMIGEQQDKIKQMFMDSVFNSVLQEEFVKNLNLDNILMNPGVMSGEMIAADLKTVKRYQSNEAGLDKNEELRPGQFLIHQLEVIDRDVERKLSEGAGVDLPQIAEAIFEMRQKLIEGIEAQKALGIAYANEEEVYSRTSEITDKVLIRLIKEEYKGGEISVLRLAQILCRLIPEADEIKRLLPKIKSALLEEGMSQADFMSLIQQLGKELQSDGLANILSDTAEEIGVNGEDIIRQVKENPRQSAEMIYLASEIRKNGGDEKALTDLLVNYVERAGSKYSQEDHSGEKSEDSEGHIRQTLVDVKSTLLQQLGSLDIKDDLLRRLEERVNEKMNEIFVKLRSEWIRSHSAASEQKIHRELTVLETLESGVREDEGIGQILKIIREKVTEGEIDENDFAQIYPEIIRLEQLRRSEKAQKVLPAGIIPEEMLMSYMDREILRARRYKTPISILGFSLVKIKAKKNINLNKINKRDVLDALLNKFVEIFRAPDVVGEVRKNQFIAILPMTDQGQANLALKRVMKLIHLNSLDVHDVPLEIKVAGVAADISIMDIENAETLIDHLTHRLKDMATRISNLHAY